MEWNLKSSREDWAWSIAKAVLDFQHQAGANGESEGLINLQLQQYAGGCEAPSAIGSGPTRHQMTHRSVLSPYMPDVQGSYAGTLQNDVPNPALQL